MSEPFELLGHDCPLGAYPAPVVPVGKFGGKLVAIYATASGSKVVEVASDAEFTVHDSDTNEALRNFSPHEQRLFAYEAHHVVAYDVSEEQTFFARILRDTRDPIEDPFVRLALAKATRDALIVQSELAACARHLATSAPGLLTSWYEQERLQAVEAGIEESKLPRDPRTFSEHLGLGVPHRESQANREPDRSTARRSRGTGGRPKSKLNVCVLSPQKSVLTEIGRLLSSKHDWKVISEQLESTLPPDFRSFEPPKAQVYVIDALTARQANGALLSNILERHPDARLIVVGEQHQDSANFSLLRLGVKGILTYTEARYQLIRALPLVAAGGFWLPRTVLSGFVDSILSGQTRHLKSDSVANLSRREQEVFDSLLENLSNKEIASKLNIAERTVKFHVSSLLNRFRVRRRGELILQMYQRRLVGE